MTDAEPTIQVALADYVTIPRFSASTGMTVKAVQRKIEDGKWLEGRQYRRAPDGTIRISIRGYYAWVEQGRE